MEKLTYEEVIDIIENKRRFGNLTGVEISKKMLEMLGHPEEGMNFIHIAGTNGKGSVSAFLCSILQEAGLKTGMFTSPHLVDFRERIQVNGVMIEKEKTRRLGAALLEQDFGVYPTMFDYCLVMALQYFKEEKCDVVVLETGLGGRLDSTNAVGVPKVSVITKIGYDHMAILGNTLPEIAAEKAGIIKKGTRLILESQESEVETLLQKCGKEAGVSDLLQIHPQDIVTEETKDFTQSFSYQKYHHLSMKMLGVHQYENAVVALLAAESYLTKETKLEEKDIETAIKKGISKTVWKGRMELISENPFFLIDGAHNSNGVEALKKSLVTLFPGEKFHFIMGVMADKDYDVMIEELLPLAIDFKTVTVESSRALQGEELADYIRKCGVPAANCSTLQQAMPDLKEVTSEKNIAFGSLYFIGEIEALLKDKSYRNFT